MVLFPQKVSPIVYVDSRQKILTFVDIKILCSITVIQIERNATEIVWDLR